MFVSGMNSKIEMNMGSLENPTAVICLPISTRGIGFATAACEMLLKKETNLEVDSTYIQELYCASLALLEVKIKKVTPPTLINPRVGRFHLGQSICVEHLLESKLHLPDILTNIINSVGVLRFGDKVFYPNISLSSDYAIEMPYSELVTFSNYEDVIRMLRSSKTSIEYRQQFYNNNPLPCAIWKLGDNIGPILDNEYLFSGMRFFGSPLTDNFLSFMAEWKQQAPHRFTQPIMWNSPGSKAMLVCNNQSGMRLTENNVFEGNIGEYYNLEPISMIEEQINGTFSLLGETSAFKQNLYPTRDLRVCKEYRSDNTYKDILNKKLNTK